MLSQVTHHSAIFGPIGPCCVPSYVVHTATRSPSATRSLIVWTESGKTAVSCRRKSQLLGSTKGTVASSQPAYPNDRSGGSGQGSPKATGGSRRAASLRRPTAAVTLDSRSSLVPGTWKVPSTSRISSSLSRLTSMMVRGSRRRCSSRHALHRAA